MTALTFELIRLKFEQLVLAFEECCNMFETFSQLEKEGNL